jgi:hypothetical protein
MADKIGTQSAPLEDSFPVSMGTRGALAMEGVADYHQRLFEKAPLKGIPGDWISLPLALLSIFEDGNGCMIFWRASVTMDKG